MSVGEILERDNDRPAYVRFERRAVKDKEATLREGHYMSKDEDYVLITPPYSKDCVEKKVSTWFPQVETNVKAGRVPQRHFDLWKNAYESWKNGQEAPLDGTSVKDWNALSPAQCTNLIAAGCRTIEDLAQANDEALRRIGMGAVELKTKARSWLQAAKDHGPIVMEVSALQKENTQLKGSIESIQDQVTLLTRQLDAKQTISPDSTTPIQETVQSISASDIIETPMDAYREKHKNLRAEYKKVVGRNPHKSASESAIKKRIAKG